MRCSHVTCYHGFLQLTVQINRLSLQDNIVKYPFVNALYQNTEHNDNGDAPNASMQLWE